MGIPSNFIQTILLLIALHGLLLAAMMGIGQLIADWRSLRHRLFFGLFLVFALLTLHYLLFKVGALERYPLFYILGIVPFYLLGPLLYLLSSLLLEQKSGGWRIYLHFLPAFLAATDATVVLLALQPSSIRVFSGYFYNFHMLLIGGGGGFLFAVYLLRIWIILRREFVWSRKRILKNPAVLVVYGMLSLFSMASLTDLATVLTGEIIFMELSLLLVNGVVFFLFFVSFRFPAFYGKLREVVREESQRRSYLVGMDPERIESGLKKMMEVQKIYRLSDLSLDFLAEKVGLSRHQLSEYLNTKHRQNFKNYVNRFRIREATRLLSETGLTVLEIAYESGFGSKSSFNSAFIKEVGCTPSAYRKRKA